MSTNWTEKDLVAQFKRCLFNNQEWLKAFRAAAAAWHWPVEILVAIGSRETNIRNIIGDKGHGFGIMQIDIRYHKDHITSGAWKIPARNITQGVKILSGWRDSVGRTLGRPMDDPLVMQIAIASYNAGAGPLIAYHSGLDPDIRTTGHDYSKDVLGRSVVFAKFVAELQGEPNASTDGGNL